MKEAGDGMASLSTYRRYVQAVHISVEAVQHSINVEAVQHSRHYRGEGRPPFLLVGALGFAQAVQHSRHYRGEGRLPFLLVCALGFEPCLLLHTNPQVGTCGIVMVSDFRFGVSDVRFQIADFRFRI